MEHRLERLRRRYNGFRRRQEDVFAVREEAWQVLDQAKKSGNVEVLVEIEDMLVDLEFSVEENRCKCHRKRSSC